MTADIICRGVPSPVVLQGRLAELERARGARQASRQADSQEVTG